MSKTISETFYGSPEPQWLVESPKEVQTHFDRRGCVRQIRTSVYQTNADVHTPGRSENLAKRSSYPLEQPSMVNADRKAYVYNAVPATHGTVDRPVFNALNTNIVSNIPIVEFMVPLCCGKCEEKVREELENVEGVYKVLCDQHNQRVTVYSTLDPERLLKRVKRIKKKSYFWSGGRNLHGVRHVPSLPRDYDLSLAQRSNIPVYKSDPAHHRSASRISGQHQRYVSPRSSYDPVETQYMKRKSLGPHSEDPHFYYADVEHQYKIPSHVSSPLMASIDASQSYTTGTPYFSNPLESSLDYGHHPSSYGAVYEYCDDYGTTEYY
ncbi:hypothetical protein KC19_8G042700 [Ceratodon purpureus]|uniref:HMA domain-containing protein n=1 Tax=Ceratodon purpureus TaxID=3225 RepID=A0A8T0H0J7_CERPU|nr:hypothetical protein KC19_8G042700 [Ceratodon purpureus]